MGDRRFDAAYRAVAEAPDPAAAIRALDDEEVVHALAAASRKMDGYLANVLAVEVLNRRRRQRALHWGLIAGLGTAVTLRTALLFAYRSQSPLFALGLGALAIAALVGLGTYATLARGGHG